MKSKPQIILFEDFLMSNNFNFYINYGSEIFENSNLNKEITNSSITLSSEMIKPINKIFKVKTKFVSMDVKGWPC